MHLGDRDHRGIERGDAARHDGLQGRDDLRGDDHRIDAALRPRAVRPLAGDVDVEQAAARHLRARADRELADIELRAIVHAENLLAREFLEEAVLHHRLGAATAFLGRLEDEVHRAVEVARGGEILGGAQQHRGVTVMTAGVHAALVLAAVIEGVVFVHRQRIHVGAQPDRLGIVADPDRAHDSGLADAGGDLAAPLLQFLRHDLRRAHLLEAKLGMGMDVAPDGGQFGGSGGDLGFDFHGQDSNRKDVITRRNSPACTFGKKCPPSGRT